MAWNQEVLVAHRRRGDGDEPRTMKNEMTHRNTDGRKKEQGEMKMRKRVALYARTNHGDRKLLEVQLERGREYAEREGAEVVGEYREKRGSRDRLRTMLLDAGDAKRGFDELVVWTMHRLSESVMEQDRYVQELRRAGTEVVALVKPRAMDHRGTWMRERETMREINE